MPNENSGDSRRRTHTQPGSPRATRPASGGTRFRSAGAQPAAVNRQQASGTRFRTSQTQARPNPRPVQPATRSRYAAQSSSARRGGSPIKVIVGIVAALAVVAALVFVVVPRVSELLGGGQPAVEAGQEVQLTIPEGASGDDIAAILAQNHIIDNPKDYYAAVNRLDASMSLKPGDYILYTGQDPEEVVQQLVDGPNVEGNKITIQEGLTVAQTAARVEETFGIPADEFIAQAKASNYVADYPFLEGAYDDSLEGYLYPKTYSFTDVPTADEIIRAQLDQFVTETSSLDLNAGPSGLTAQQIVTMASLIERETAVESERPTVASVIYNRLAIDMPLQIDAAIVYARGGGSDPVTYSDLEIDSPYNVYTNYGLTPGPICSPSISSISAALNPDDTDYLYYVASAAGDGSHKFSSDYEQFEADSEEYAESLQ